MADGRKLVKTGTPGIFRRQNGDGSAGAYCVIFRAGGKQRREYAPTLEAARRIKRQREADRDRGEWQERSTITLRDFLADWIDRYQGTGRRGFRANTREEYRRLLDNFAHRYFDERLRLVDVTPHRLAQFVGWLCDEEAQGRRVAEERRAAKAARRDVPLSSVPMPPVEPMALADATVRNALIPVRAALAGAQREGLIRHNPASGLALPHRERVNEGDADEHAKALDREQLAALLALVHPDYRVLLRTMASTGLRVSEAIGLQRRHLRLDGSRPHLLVRRAIVKGRIEPPKSRHGRRTVPLPASLVSELRRHVAALPPGDHQLVFPSQAGTPLDPDNLRTRMLKPIMEEVGASGLGFHALRHTYASLQLSAGTNVLQLSRALGHHSPAFTLERYAHLLDDDLAPALDLDDALRVTQRVNVPDGEVAVNLAGECISLQAKPALQSETAHRDARGRSPVADS